MKIILSRSLQLGLLSILAYLCLAGIMNLIKLNGRTAASWATSYIQRVGDQEWSTFRDLDSSATQYDFVALGSSHAMHGYDPRIFRKHGFELFNFGSSNQHSSVSYMLAKYYLDLPEKPIFLLDVYHAVFEGNELESTGRMMSNIPDTRPAFSLFEMDPDIRTLNSFVSRMFRDEMRAEFQNSRYVENGFCENPDTMKTSLQPYNGIPRLNEGKFERMDALLTLLESRGCRYILVAHPMPHAPGFEPVHNSFRARMLQLVEKHHATFIDHTLDNYLSDSAHFYNPTHLNQAGIEIYNERLLRELKEKGFVPAEK